MKLTNERLLDARTDGGGFRFAQIKFAYAAMGRDWKGKPEKGWLQEFIRTDLPEEVWNQFCLLSQSKRKGEKAQIIAKKKPATKKKRIGKKSGANNNHDFLNSREWAELRYKVLSASDGCCSLCGRSKREHDVVLQVDHIKPRAKYPELAYDIDNLQVLCAACNFGKGNRDKKDWRKSFCEEMEIITEARRAFGQLY